MGVGIVYENKVATTIDLAVPTYKKIDQSTMSICDTNTLISIISTNPQVKFKNLAINTTELEKLDKPHSLKLLITELKTNFAQYDLLTTFNIIACINFMTGKMILITQQVTLGDLIFPITIVGSHQMTLHFWISGMYNLYL